jgi:hypothetical protein
LHVDGHDGDFITFAEHVGNFFDPRGVSPHGGLPEPASFMPLLIRQLPPGGVCARGGSHACAVTIELRLGKPSLNKEMPMTPAPVTVEDVTDPVDIAQIHAQIEQAQRNSSWLQSHWDDLLPEAFGKFIAIAGLDAHIASSAEEAWAWAKSAHPDDSGALVEYVLPPGGPRFYANRR